MTISPTYCSVCGQPLQPQDAGPAHHPLDCITLLKRRVIEAECRVGIDNKLKTDLACAYADVWAALRDIVSQGEAQFRCGDRYATFNKQAIEAARKVLEGKANG